jgi:hypothetical protein
VKRGHASRQRTCSRGEARTRRQARRRVEARAGRKACRRGGSKKAGRKWRRGQVFRYAGPATRSKARHAGMAMQGEGSRQPVS